MDLTLIRLRNNVVAYFHSYRTNRISMAATITFETAILACFLPNTSNSPGTSAIYQTIYAISNNTAV
jgi:hypothetical protein